MEITLSPLTKQLIQCKEPLGKRLHSIKNFTISYFYNILSLHGITNPEIMKLVEELVGNHSTYIQIIEKNYLQNCNILSINLPVSSLNIKELRDSVDHSSPIVPPLDGLNNLSVNFVNKLVEIRGAYNTLNSLASGSYLRELQMEMSRLETIQTQMKNLMEQFRQDYRKAFQKSYTQIHQISTNYEVDPYIKELLERWNQKMRECFNYDQPFGSIKPCGNHPDYVLWYKEREGCQRELELRKLEQSQLKQKIYDHSCEIFTGCLESVFQNLETEKRNLENLYKTCLSKILTLKMKIAGIPEAAINPLQDKLSELQTLLFFCSSIATNLDSSLSLTEKLLQSEELEVETIKKSLTPLLSNFVVLEYAHVGRASKVASVKFDSLYGDVMKRLLDPDDKPTSTTVADFEELVELYCL